MIERTMTGFGNRVTYAGMDTLDRRARNAVESAQGGRIDWSQAYSNYTGAARHTAYASANKVPLFLEARPVPLDRHLSIELMLKGARVVPITEHGEEPVPYGVTEVAPFADQALNALQITEGIARLSPQFITPAQRNRYNQARNTAITQRNEALAAATGSGSLPTVPSELDPINEYASFLQNPVNLRDLVRDSYPRPKQGEEVRDDFAVRLELDMEALNKFAGMAWVGGGGAIGDFGNNARDWMLLEAFIKGGKPVAGICYGSIVLAQVKDSLTGAYLLQGHFATGHGDADNYTEDTATMNPDGTYNPSISGAAPINLSGN